MAGATNYLYYFPELEALGIQNSDLHIALQNFFLAMSKLLEQLTNVKSFYIENCALFVVLHYTYLLPEPQ